MRLINLIQFLAVVFILFMYHCDSRVYNINKRSCINENLLSFTGTVDTFYHGLRQRKPAFYVIISKGDSIDSLVNFHFPPDFRETIRVGDSISKHANSFDVYLYRKLPKDTTIYLKDNFDCSYWDDPEEYEGQTQYGSPFKSRD